MCANFTFHPSETQIRNTFPKIKIDEAAPFDKTKDDVFPFIYAPVITKEGDHLLFTAKRYSLTPSWSATEKVKWATYNARLNRVNEKKKNALEFIYEVPTWRESFGKHHCLIPMNQFKESCHEGEASGHIVKFVPEDKNLLFAAGIYNDWVDKKTGEVVSTFAVITTDPDEYIKSVGHDRSPVFLDSESARRWLEPFKSPQDAYAFLEKHALRPKLIYEIDRKLKTKH